MGKSKKTTTNTGIDPKSQAYIDAQRAAAQQGADVAATTPLFTGPQTQSVADQAAVFMNPYQKNVIDASNAEFDHLRAGAATSVAQGATGSHALGGSRQAVSQAVRMGALDRTQAQTNAGLLYSGYGDALSQGTAYAENQRQLAEQKMQEPLMQQQNRLGFYTQGYGGPTGSTTTSEEKGNFWSGVGDVVKTAAGAAATYYGAKNLGQNPGQLQRAQAAGGPVGASMYSGQRPGMYNPQFQSAPPPPIFANRRLGFGRNEHLP